MPTDNFVDETSTTHKNLLLKNWRADVLFLFVFRRVFFGVFLFHIARIAIVFAAGFFGLYALAVGFRPAPVALAENL